MDLFEKYLTDGKGLSSTSANYIANVGKEYITEHEAKLAKAAVLYDTTQQLMTNNVKLNTGYGCKDEDVYEFESILNTIADIKALTAWIREAIKTKELMVKNIQTMSFEKYVTDILHEDINEYRERYRIKYDNAEYDRTVNEQAEYLKAEATAAVFGKFIHSNGAFNKGRDMLYKIQNNPIEIEGNGQDRIIVKRHNSVDSAIVDEVYMKLQGVWRSHEAQLNKYKHNTETENNRRAQKANAEVSIRQAKYDTKLVKFEEWKEIERERISNLKIVIPDMFEGIYTYLEDISKK